MQFSIKDSAGAAVNISGFSFLLTVDPDANPTTDTNNLFELTGTIDDAPNGLVSFAPSAVEADQTPETYFYDIQMTDAGSAIRTIAKGKYVVTQDITK
jgi:hypothetical protein